MALATALRPVDHAKIALTENNLGNILNETLGPSDAWEAKGHILKALEHQRLHYRSVLKEGTGAKRSGLPYRIGQHWGETKEGGGLSLTANLQDATSNMLSTLICATDTLGGLFSNEEAEKMLLEANDLARRHGNASRGRGGITALSNLYSDGRIMLIRQTGLTPWKEPAKRGWRLQQARLLRMELDEIAAITGRTVEHECVICLEDLEGGGDAEGGDGGGGGGGVGELEPVFVFPTCFHRLHVACAMEQHKAQIKDVYAPHLSVQDKQLKCPTCN